MAIFLVGFGIFQSCFLFIWGTTFGVIIYNSMEISHFGWTSLALFPVKSFYWFIADVAAEFSSLDCYLMTLMIRVNGTSIFLLRWNFTPQIASFIKTHIFSRRRPIDGWKYMIEQIGPNAKKGKGSVSRLPSVSDAGTQPFKEENAPIRSDFPSNTGR